MIPKRNVPPRGNCNSAPKCKIIKEVRNPVEKDGVVTTFVTFDEVDADDADPIHYRAFDPDKCAEMGIKPLPPVMGNDPFKNFESASEYAEKAYKSVEEAKIEYENKIKESALAEQSKNLE